MYKLFSQNTFILIMKKCKSKFRPDFLASKNDFIVGMGSVLNVAGRYFEYNSSNTAEEADAKALRSDWKNIGLDVEDSIEKFEKSNRKKLCLK